MPKIEYYYFPAKGLGDAGRMLLAYGGEDWEDKRIPFEEWPAFKPKTAFGQMPVMIVDGKQYAQSLAIARYLGRKHGLAGNDLEEDFLIDQNVELIYDIRVKGASVHYEKNAEYKAQKHADFSKNVYPGLLDKLDQIIRENNGHIALGRLTWADFVFASIYAYLKVIMQTPDLDAKYPSFKKLQDTVYSLPKVKAWVDTVPKQPFDY